MLWFKPDVAKLYSRKNFDGLIRALLYKKDKSIQLQAKQYLIELAEKAGERVAKRYDYDDIVREELQDTLIEMCKQNESTLRAV